MPTIIDLTWELYEGMPSHPAHPVAPKVLSGTMSHPATRPWFPEATPYGRVSFANEQVIISGHMGTHIDAPFHGDPEGPTVEGIPLDAVFGPAVWLDVSLHCGPRTQITARMLAEAMHQVGGHLSPIVLLHTGWSRFVQEDPRRYFCESLGIAEDGAVWLRTRGARTVGIDAPTVDSPGDRVCPAHMLFLRAPDGKPPTYVVENLIRIDQIPSHRFTFAGFPLLLKGASGSPIRAVAIVE